jgi:hypothetical protein
LRAEVLAVIGRVCAAGHTAAVPWCHAEAEAGAAAGRSSVDVVLSAVLCFCAAGHAMPATVPLFPEVVDKLRQEQQQPAA